MGTDLAINYFGHGNTYMNVTSGRVGIGTHDPAYPLHLKSSSDDNWMAGFHNTSTSTSSNGLVVRADGGDPFWVQNASKTMFSVKQDGNVGIGTAYPDCHLEIITSDNEDVMRFTRFTGWPVLLARANWDGSASLALYEFNETKLNLSSGGTSYINGGSLGIGTSTPSNAKLQIEGVDTYDAMLRLNNIGIDGASFFMGSTNSAWGGGINSNRFVMGHGAPSSANIDVAIDENGWVGIGTISPTKSLDVNGRGRFRGLLVGIVSNAVYQTSDGTLITGSSDIRLKENIEPLQNSLDKVMSLQGVTFSWKADPTKRQSIGFIAQEFEQVVPELVFTNQNDGYKGINYAEVTALLVEAIKDQQKIIEALETRIEQLESR